jgi:hypothetical protein
VADVERMEGKATALAKVCAAYIDRPRPATPRTAGDMHTEYSCLRRRRMRS